MECGGPTPLSVHTERVALHTGEAAMEIIA